MTKTLCKICNQEFTSLGSHITKKHQITSKEYYNKYLSTENNNGICKMFGIIDSCKQHTQFIDLNKGYLRFCSSKCASNCKETRDKFVETVRDKYGVDNPTQIDEIKQINSRKMQKTEEEWDEINEKKRQTNIERFGVPYPMMLKEHVERVKQTNIEKYGVECTIHNPEIQEKVKKTFIKRYGVENPMQSYEIKEKMRDTIRKKRFPYIKEILRDVYKLELMSEYETIKSILVLRHIPCGNIIHEHYFNIYQGPHPCQVCYPRHSGISNIETDFNSFVRSLFSDASTVILNERSIINNPSTGRPWEIDVYVPTKKIGFEFDGLYHHCDLFKEKTYHIDKTIACNEQGVFLLHIFEDEWILKRPIVEDRVRNILGINDEAKKVNGRDCNIEVISPQEKNNFLELFHLQGEDRSNIHLGAFSNGELVAVMTFSGGSISKGSRLEEGIWELNRFCTRIGYRVIGIAGKLLEYFKRNYIWKEIFSYADRRWSRGDLYKTLGFELVGVTPINYWYIKNDMKIHRFNLRKRFNESAELTEKELRKQEGYNIIYDCGNLKFRMRKE